MKRLELFFIYLAALILQITVMRHFTIFGVSANLLLALTVVYSFFFQNFNGIIFGAAFGMVLDICTGPAAGISSLLFFFIGMGLLVTRIGVYRDNKLILLAVTAITTFLYYAGYWIISVLLLQSGLHFLYVMQKVPPAIVLNYIVIIIVYLFARKKKGFTI